MIIGKMSIVQKFSAKYKTYLLIYVPIVLSWLDIHLFSSYPRFSGNFYKMKVVYLKCYKVLTKLCLYIITQTLTICMGVWNLPHKVHLYPIWIYLIWWFRVCVLIRAQIWLKKYNWHFWFFFNPAVVAWR